MSAGRYLGFRRIGRPAWKAGNATRHLTVLDLCRAGWPRGQWRATASSTSAAATTGVCETVANVRRFAPSGHRGSQGRAVTFGGRLNRFWAKAGSSCCRRCRRAAEDGRLLPVKRGCLHCGRQRFESPPLHHPAPELNPVENIWQYLRQNWLSNRVFENYGAIVDAACSAWRKLIADPTRITSIGMRDWAHIGQSSRPLVLSMGLRPKAFRGPQKSPSFS